ncbi:MAG: helix-turn-helix transcriptional regulator [Pirellulales bacterium]
MTGRFQRELLRGTLELMVLSSLAHGRKYGYLIQRQLRESSQSRVDLPAGTLYPILHRLEEEQWIKSSWDEDSGRKRKWYEITQTGLAQLKVEASEWQSYASYIQGLLALAMPDSPSALKPCP